MGETTQESYPLEAIHEPEPMRDEKEILLQHTTPRTPILWCGGRGGECHDVSIILVPNEINGESSNATDHPKETLAVLKVHSGRLSKCSKYFETCLNERWKKPSSSSSSLEFVLETHTDVAYYGDCFSRMYKHKGFKDVEYSLGLLKVASQIQFDELMDSILLHLSSKAWSDADATMIKLYAASPDFPRDHAQDLVVRLGMDKSKEDWHNQLCECIRAAFRHDFKNLCHHRALIKELFLDGALDNGSGNGAGADSSVTKDVIMIVSREAKDMLLNVERECNAAKNYQSVSRFADKVLAVRWILEVLLVANVAEEVVQCFVHLNALPKFLDIGGLHAADFEERSAAKDAAVQLAKLVLVVCREVAAGNLLLKAPERAALFQNWYPLLKKLFGNNVQVDQVTKDIFSTLPLQLQMDQLIKSQCQIGVHKDYFNMKLLAKVLKAALS